MIKYILLFCFLLTNKIYPQDFHMSYDISYKKDMEKIKMNFKKASDSTIDNVMAKDKDTIDADNRKKRQSVLAMEVMMPLMLSEYSHDKHVSLTINDSLLIEKRTLLNDSINEKILKIINLKEYYQDEIELVEIQEDKTNTKMINGYLCHKVYFKVVGNNTMPEMSTTNYEMYATNKIKILYHPVIRFKNILEKYFPMEIITHHQELKGFEIKHSINTIKH